MLKKNISYLTLNDLHLGHSRNKTKDLIENLNKYFIVNKSKIDNVDIIFIAGDVYDKLIDSYSEDYILIIDFLTKLIMYCKKYKIKLRILEGTPSHDWKQIRVIDTIIHRLKIDIDFKYVDTLCIENINEYNLNILYLPDEWNDDPLITLNEVKELLKSNNLTKVDIMIAHGQFGYQIPNIVLHNSHDEEEYLNLVKYFIHIGHIHTHSVFKRILATGSFDRLNQGEEEDKGGVITYLNRSERNSFIFIPNKEAKIFKSLKIKYTELDSVINYVFKKTKNFKDGSFIRLMVEYDNPIKKSLHDIKNKFTRFNISIKTLKSNDEKTSRIIFNKDFSLNITKDNILDLLSIEMNKYDLTKNDVEIYKNELKMII